MEEWLLTWSLQKSSGRHPGLEAPPHKEEALCLLIKTASQPIMESVA